MSIYTADDITVTPANSKTHLLDNPGWYSLLGKHSDIAIRGSIATRYPPEYHVIAATPDDSEESFRT